MAKGSFLKLTFPPLPLELFKQYQGFMDIYKLDPFHMLVFMLMCATEVFGKDQARANALVVEASKHPNPWDRGA